MKSSVALNESLRDVPPVERLTAHFYERARLDPVLAPLFATLPGDHRTLVAEFIGEVLADARDRGKSRAGHAHALARQLGCYATLNQRRRWMDLLIESADAVRLRDFRAFHSALVAYLEWGARLALHVTEPASLLAHERPVPSRSWGALAGAYCA